MKPPHIPGYDLADEIGAGSSGSVFRAVQIALARPVAVKVLSPGLFDARETRERFLREARLQAALSHPAILAVYDSGVADGRPYLVMELIQGASLRAVLDAGGLQPITAALTLGRQLAEGVAAAHAGGVIHRDLKPENVMVTHEGRVKIADFGLAKTQAARALNQTHEGVVLGTPGYIAPEVLAGEPATPAADLYAVGAILYELITGRRAFMAMAVADILDEQLNGTPPPPLTLRPDAPEQLCLAIDRCLEKSPGGRPAASELASLLAHLESGESLRSPPESAPASGPSLATVATKKPQTKTVRAELSPKDRLSPRLKPPPKTRVMAPPSEGTPPSRGRGPRARLPLAIVALAIVAGLTIFAASRSRKDSGTASIPPVVTAGPIPPATSLQPPAPTRFEHSLDSWLANRRTFLLRVKIDLGALEFAGIRNIGVLKLEGFAPDIQHQFDELTGLIRAADQALVRGPFWLKAARAAAELIRWLSNADRMQVNRVAKRHLEELLRTAAGGGSDPCRRALDNLAKAAARELLEPGDSSRSEWLDTLTRSIATVRLAAGASLSTDRTLLFELLLLTSARATCREHLQGRRFDPEDGLPGPALSEWRELFEFAPAALSLNDTPSPSPDASLAMHMLLHAGARVILDPRSSAALAQQVTSLLGRIESAIDETQLASENLKHLEKNRRLIAGQCARLRLPNPLRLQRPAPASALGVKVRAEIERAIVAEQELEGFLEMPGSPKGSTLLVADTLLPGLDSVESCTLVLHTDPEAGRGFAEPSFKARVSIERIAPGSSEPTVVASARMLMEYLAFASGGHHPIQLSALREGFNRVRLDLPVPVERLGKPRFGLLVKRRFPPPPSEPPVDLSFADCPPGGEWWSPFWNRFDEEIFGNMVARNESFFASFPRCAAGWLVLGATYCRAAPDREGLDEVGDLMFDQLAAHPDGKPAGPGWKMRQRGHDAFNRALDLEPRAAEVWFRIGFSSMRSKDPAAARRALRWTLHLNPLIRDAWLRLAELESKLLAATPGDRRKALWRESVNTALSYADYNQELREASTPESPRLRYVRADLRRLLGTEETTPDRGEVK